MNDDTETTNIEDPPQPKRTKQTSAEEKRGTYFPGYVENELINTDPATKLNAIQGIINILLCTPKKQK